MGHLLSPPAVPSLSVGCGHCSCHCNAHFIPALVDTKVRSSVIAISPWHEGSGRNCPLEGGPRAWSQTGDYGTLFGTSPLPVAGPLRRVLLPHSSRHDAEPPTQSLKSESILDLLWPIEENGKEAVHCPSPDLDRSSASVLLLLGTLEDFISLLPWALIFFDQIHVNDVYHFQAETDNCQWKIASCCLFLL